MLLPCLWLAVQLMQFDHLPLILFIDCKRKCKGAFWGCDWMHVEQHCFWVWFYIFLLVVGLKKVRWRNATMPIDAHWKSSFFLAYNFSCMFPCLPLYVSEESAMKKSEDANWRHYFSMLVSFKTCIRHCPSLLIVRTTEKKLQWRNVRMRLDAHCAHWRALKRGTASLFNRPCPCQCYTPGLLDCLHVMMRRWQCHQDVICIKM